MHLCTKFEVSSSTRFGDMLTRANYEIHFSADIKGQKPYCACAVARDLGVRGQKQPHIWNPRPRFVCSLYNF